MTLLLRAFYEAYGNGMTDEASRYAKWEIAKCLWHIPTIGATPDMSALKIKSNVASDDECCEFAAIMTYGNADRNSENQYGRYARNYILFQKKIKDFQENYPIYFQIMPDRILKDCCILSIETDGQSTALRIFSTMNNRGRPLSDSDIFKAKLYMHYARASRGIKDTTVEELRDFYGRDDEQFSLLVKDYSQTFEGLRVLAVFWKDIAMLDSTRFSETVRKSLFVLHYVPNNMWTFLVSVYLRHF